MAKGLHGYDPLFKVHYPLHVFMKGRMSAWIAGQHVTIDGNMIKYMGHAVSFVKYMPAKPIKHGIKVFALCCTMPAVLLGFYVYCGKEEEVDGGTVNIVTNWFFEVSITGQRGQVLHTNNYYTSVKLVKRIFVKYGWTIIGMILTTDKKSHQDKDIPFLKLSNGARNSIKRGWYRDAVIKLKTPSVKKYYVQCTTWCDKKTSLLFEF